MATLPTAPRSAAPPPRLLRRLCARLGGWCEHLLDAHRARVPF